MKINKFYKEEFGTISSITNPDTGVVMFVAKEVCNAWGHTNPTQAIRNAGLKEDEYKTIEFKKFPKFKEQLCQFGLVSGRSPSITLVTESGMYKLVLSSNLNKAKPFKDWITEEVLPSIRKSGYYSIADQTNQMLIHTNISVQKQNSKDINTKNFLEYGKDGTIGYNVENCILHTGEVPKVVIAKGKALGLKSKQTTSAKEVLRHTKPEIACAMSFTDSLTKQGFDLKTVSELSLKCAVPLFQGMLELGIIPAELND